MRYLTLLLTMAAFGGNTFAQGKPTPKAIGFQEPVTELAVEAFRFHDTWLLLMCVVITLFVAGLLVWVMFRYSAKSNPVPSKTTHHTGLEVVWTLFPVLILVAIAVISFPLLYKYDRAPNLAAIASGEVTASVEKQAAASKGWINIKAQGNQWNWEYSFPDILDSEGFPVTFTSNPIHTGLDAVDRGRYADLNRSEPFESQPINLSVNYPLVLPAGRYIRYYTAAGDVIHSFAMPSFGIKTDAVPGRLNEGWFKVDTPGVYYGQCSELCGKDHAYMPIEIRIVPQAQYDAWLVIMQTDDLKSAARLVAEIETLPTTRLAVVN